MGTSGKEKNKINKKFQTTQDYINSLYATFWYLTVLGLCIFLLSLLSGTAVSAGYSPYGVRLRLAGHVTGGGH